MAATREDVIEFLKSMTLLEASQLVKELEETFGVSAAAAAVAAPAAGGGGEAAAPAEEKTEFDVILQAVGSNKINVIKVVRVSSQQKGGGYQLTGCRTTIPTPQT